MTEGEWLTASEPVPMLEFLRQSHLLSARKWRLFGVGCCTRIIHLLTDERSRWAVAVAERFADGEASAAELDESFNASFDVGVTLVREMEQNPDVFIASGRDPLRAAAWAASDVAHCDEAADGVAFESASTAVPGAERTSQAVLLQCIFGNPYRPVTADPAWLTSDVVALAEGIYQDRAFDRLPILTDALMDAGCDNEDILSHCRSEGPHCRGCWLIDLLTGRK